MFNLALQSQLAIALAERAAEFGFKTCQTPDLLAHISNLALEHRLDFGAGVGHLSKGEQVFNFGERETQVLCVAHKSEIMNLLLVEQAITARAARGNLDQSELLIEPDRIHADADLLCSPADVNRNCHIRNKDKP